MGCQYRYVDGQYELFDSRNENKLIARMKEIAILYDSSVGVIRSHGITAAVEKLQSNLKQTNAGGNVVLVRSSKWNINALNELIRSSGKIRLLHSRILLAAMNHEAQERVHHEQEKRQHRSTSETMELIMEAAESIADDVADEARPRNSEIAY